MYLCEPQYAFSFRFHYSYIMAASIAFIQKITIHLYRLHIDVAFFFSPAALSQMSFRVTKRTFYLFMQRGKYASVHQLKSIASPTFFSSSNQIIVRAPGMTYFNVLSICPFVCFSEKDRQTFKTNS